MRFANRLMVSFRTAAILALVTFAMRTGIESSSFADDVGIEFFESRIRPILVQHCYECHSAASEEAAGGLLLDTQAGMRSGGDSGPALDLENASNSLLLNALRHQDLKMPPSNKLPKEVVDAFSKWIEMGAPDPRDGPSQKTKLEKIDWPTAKQHWSFLPRKHVSIPTTTSQWCRKSIDAFIWDKHVANGLQPVPEADRSTWLRRVYIDLVGIPPTGEEVDAFVNNPAEDAFERVVDRLLASSTYGQRWGRYWLDLARYSDSNGADENHRYPVAWRYRDYVVEAFNRDVPYDRFIREQLAGDLLSAASSSDEEEQRRLITATGFLVIGPKMLAEQDKPKLVADLVDEQIDTVGKVFLGLTLGCARCHDHKFDPILASDYYSLAGIMHSTKSMEHLNFVSQWNERVLPDEAQAKKIAVYQQALDQSKAELNATQRRFQERSFTKQLHLLLAAMHLQDSEVASNPEFSRSNASIGNWLTILQSDTSTKKDDDVFALWRKLKAAPPESFASEADTLWRELATDVAKSKAWNSRVIAFPAPKTKLELIGLYGALLNQAFVEILDAPRTTEGKIQSKETLKIYKQLFDAGESFLAPDKFEETLTDSEKASFSALKTKVVDMEKAKPIAARAMAVQEGEVRLVAVNVRGNHLQTAGAPLARTVPRVFREGADVPDLKIPDGFSGRLELANWISDNSNPLTARVIVNRIWQGHFGQGLVSTASNFGFRGELPSHPELLDSLANEFVAHDWSLKWLHREIVLSAVYRLSSHRDPIAEATDPDNKWLWRQNKHQMEAEVLRDSLLSIGDLLSLNLGGESQNMSVPTNPHIEGAQSIGNMRRTIYLDVNRAAMSDYLTTFDYVEPGVSVDRRSNTIVPHQALFLMNNPLPLEIGKQFASKLHATTQNDAERFSIATKSLLGRLPTQSECNSLVQFLAKGSIPASTAPESDSQTPSLSRMNSSVEQWIRVCRSLLLTNEFFYVE